MADNLIFSSTDHRGVATVTVNNAARRNAWATPASANWRRRSNTSPLNPACALSC